MHKKIIIFCDGTWNKADQQRNGRPCPTNVLRLFEATCHQDREGNPQVAHYIEGVGTRASERLAGDGFGFGISSNIINAYSFIVSNYEPGDEILLFGFSRGAFTARSLAGMIYNVGVLRRDQLHLVKEAYGMYRSKNWHPKSQASIAFRDANSHKGDAKIAFLGVWDTVGALGAPFGVVLGWITDKLFHTKFHDTKLSPIVLSAYHALAIDEHRWPFRPTQWELSEEHQARIEESRRKGQTLPYEEKWFPGAHSNVGGGYPSPESRLADCTLNWMIEKAKFHGLRVDPTRISTPEFQPDVSAKPRNSLTIFYRIPTILFVLPRKILRQLLPKKIVGWLFSTDDAQFVGNVGPGGGYLRPIANQGNVAEAIARPNFENYDGSLSSCTLQKLVADPIYRPRNIMGPEAIAQGTPTRTRSPGFGAA